MREKTIYVANDGKEFSTKESCINYEIKNNIDIEKLIEAAKTIHDICNAFEDCNDCPLKRADKGTCRFNENRFTVPPGEAWNFNDME